VPGRASRFAAQVTACRNFLELRALCDGGSWRNPTDQLIRWAKFTLSPCGPRTAAMRQMASC
jgi:hypothetical protein